MQCAEGVSTEGPHYQPILHPRCFLPSYIWLLWLQVAIFTVVRVMVDFLLLSTEILEVYVKP